MQSVSPGHPMLYMNGCDIRELFVIHRAREELYDQRKDTNKDRKKEGQDLQ